jgi:ABC-type transport system involved in multi-copper enzyme maturation permease subunit
MGAIIAIASTTLGEAIRRKVLLIILLIGIGLLIVTPGLQQLAPRQATTVLVALGLGVIQMVGALVAVVLTISLIPQEIERRTIYTILAKPVQRHHFLLGKFFGSVATLLMMMALMTVVFLLVFYIQNHQIPPNLLQGPPLFFLQMVILAAVALFFSTFVSPIVNFFLSFGVYMVGNIGNPLFASLSSARGVNEAARVGAVFVHYVFPNFANYNVQNPIINPQSEIGNVEVYTIQVVLYALVYTGILLITSILIFERREV